MLRLGYAVLASAYHGKPGQILVSNTVRDLVAGSTSDFMTKVVIP